VKKRHHRATAGERKEEKRRKEKKKRKEKSRADAARVSARTAFAGTAKRVTIIADKQRDIARNFLAAFVRERNILRNTAAFDASRRMKISRFQKCTILKSGKSH